MPPFQPSALVPVPRRRSLPRPLPRAADSIAATTSSRAIRRARMSFTVHPSFVSPTTALTDRTRSFPGRARVQPTTASTAMPTASVLVRTIGVSMFPSSRTWRNPAALPNPFPTYTAAGTFSWNRFPPCGRIAVTPVRIESPSIDRPVPDADAGDVRDRVASPGREHSGPDPEVADPRTLLRGGGTGGCEREQHERRKAPVQRAQQNVVSTAFGCSRR